MPRPYHCHASSSIPIIHLNLPHIDNATNAVTLLHDIETLVDILKRLSVSNELINLQLAIHIIGDQAWQLCTALDTAKSTSLICCQFILLLC